MNESGVTSIASDSGSQTTFGISNFTVNGLLFDSDVDSLALAEFLVKLYKDPLYRFDKVRVDFAGTSISVLNQALIVALDLGDNVRVKRTFATGSPLSVSQDVSIQRIEHSISPTAHSIRLRLSSTRIVYELILDSATYGVLDSDNALA